MPPTRLTVYLLSDAAISSGSRTPGLVDAEVVHDDLGLPYVPGKTLHGLLRETWLSLRDHFPDLKEEGRRLLGEEGDYSELAVLRIGDATSPPEVAQWARYAVGREHHPLRPEMLLGTVTDIRSQTALSRKTGGPEAHSLRNMRVVLRETCLFAPLQWLAGEPTVPLLQCLALCALGTRHLGLSRNRGLGFVRVTLEDDWSKTCSLAKGENVSW